MRLDFKCSSTGRQYAILFRRESQKQPYKVVETVTEKTISNSEDSSQQPDRDTLDIDISEIESSEIRCPYCDGGNYSFIQCGCGGLSCAGEVREHNGKYSQRCPWCETWGSIEEEIQKVSGTGLNEQRMLEKDREGLHDQLEDTSVLTRELSAPP